MVKNLHLVNTTCMLVKKKFLLSSRWFH